MLLDARMPGVTGAKRLSSLPLDEVSYSSPSAWAKTAIQATTGGATATHTLQIPAGAVAGDEMVVQCWNVYIGTATSPPGPSTPTITQGTGGTVTMTAYGTATAQTGVLNAQNVGAAPRRYYKVLTQNDIDGGLITVTAQSVNSGANVTYSMIAALVFPIARLSPTTPAPQQQSSISVTTSSSIQIANSTGIGQYVRVLCYAGPTFLPLTTSGSYAGSKLFEVQATTGMYFGIWLGTGVAGNMGSTSGEHKMTANISAFYWNDYILGNQLTDLGALLTSYGGRASAWGELFSSTPWDANEIDVDVEMVAGMNNSPIILAAECLVDIGVGAAGAEQVIVPRARGALSATGFGSTSLTGAVWNGILNLRLPVLIPAGSRVAARIATRSIQSTTQATAAFGAEFPMSVSATLLGDAA